MGSVWRCSCAVLDTCAVAALGSQAAHGFQARRLLRAYVAMQCTLVPAGEPKKSPLTGTPFGEAIKVCDPVLRLPFL